MRQTGVHLKLGGVKEASSERENIVKRSVFLVNMQELRLQMDDLHAGLSCPAGVGDYFSNENSLRHRYPVYLAGGAADASGIGKGPSYLYDPYLWLRVGVIETG